MAEQIAGSLGSEPLARARQLFHGLPKATCQATFQATCQATLGILALARLRRRLKVILPGPRLLQFSHGHLWFYVGHLLETHVIPHTLAARLPGNRT